MLFFYHGGHKEKPHKGHKKFYEDAAIHARSKPFVNSVRFFLMVFVVAFQLDLVDAFFYHGGHKGISHKGHKKFYEDAAKHARSKPFVNFVGSL
jgi:hypothetical protein